MVKKVQLETFDPPSELLKKKSWDEGDEVVLGR